MEKVEHPNFYSVILLSRNHLKERPLLSTLCSLSLGGLLKTGCSLPQSKPMDPTLLPFLQSIDPSEREHLLGELILGQAAPLVRQTLWYKLRFYLDKTGASPATPEAEDLYHDVIAKLIRVLNQLQLQDGKTRIKDFRRYTIRIAVNVCNDYLRSKYPVRTRLKDRVRDTLERHQDFDLWMSEQGQILCGLAIWRHETEEISLFDRAKMLENHPEIIKQEQFSRLDSQKIPLTETLAKIFEWVRAPIELECLVNVTAVVLDIKEPEFESLDDEGSQLSHRLLVEGSTHDEIIEERAALEKLWSEIRQLPPNQRDTFIFSFANSRGDDLLSLLFEAGVVTPSRMAEELGMPLDRLMMIWKEMPLRNTDIAVLFGVERQQINKWRHRATKHIEKRFLKPFIDN